jgi:pyridoxamine 5'-phosphate oxidase
LNPIKHFSLWFRAAVTRSPGKWFDPAAMTLATSNKNGEVTARMVLLKKFGREGFTFYTNYASRKGRQLSENPKAALVLYWPYLRRQIRIEGTVERLAEKEAEEYFHSRPRLYQLAAAASNQSRPIISRKYLIDRFKRLRKTFSGQPIPLPKTWGGYRLTPDRLEFWRHREHRLHDRIEYRKGKNGRWAVQRLAP